MSVRLFIIQIIAMSADPQPGKTKFDFDMQSK